MGFDIECIIDIHTYPGEYFCPVCRTLVYPNEAFQSQCTHLYCKPCLSHIASGTRACPYDGYLVTEADSKLLMDSDKALAENIGKVKVHCLYFRSGCTWEGLLSDCTSHCSACSFGNSPVICNRCGIQIVHRQVHDHAQSCPGMYGSQQAVGVAPATTKSGTNASANTVVDKQTVGQSGAPTPAQNSQVAATPAPGQNPNQQVNATSQTPAAAPVNVSSADQWYQQQYQQYYQQYMGYYQQPNQQYYQFQQQSFQQYPQHPTQVQGQLQPQVHPQSLSQSHLQPQGQPHQQVQPQPQPQPHSHPLAVSQAPQQPHLQLQAQGQAQQQPEMQLPPQVQPQIQVPPQPQVQGHVAVQGLAPNYQGNSQQPPHPSLRPQTQPLPLPPQSQPAQAPQYPQGIGMRPSAQPQVPQFQQPHLQTSQFHVQPQMQSQTQPVSSNVPHMQTLPQVQPYPTPTTATLYPPQGNQPTGPTALPPAPYLPGPPVSGHHTYPQPNPAQKMQPGSSQQVHHPPANASVHPAQVHGQVPQHPGVMRPPPQVSMPQQQPSTMLPPHNQVPFIPPPQHQPFAPHAQQAQSLQNRPVAQPVQQALPQRYAPQQHFPAPLQSQLHQQPIQPQLRPSGPTQLQQSQNYAGRPMMSNQVIHPQSHTFSSDVGPSAHSGPAQLPSTNLPTNQNYTKSTVLEQNEPVQGTRSPLRAPLEKGIDGDILKEKAGTGEIETIGSDADNVARNKSAIKQAGDNEQATGGKSVKNEVAKMDVPSLEDTDSLKQGNPENQKLTAEGPMSQQQSHGSHLPKPEVQVQGQPPSVRGPQGAAGSLPHPGQSLNPNEGRGHGYYGPAKGYEPQSTPHGPMLPTQAYQHGIMGRVLPHEAQRSKDQISGGAANHSSTGEGDAKSHIEDSSFLRKNGGLVPESMYGSKDEKSTAMASLPGEPTRPFDQASRSVDTAPHGPVHEAGSKMNPGALGLHPRFLPLHDPSGGHGNVDMFGVGPEFGQFSMKHFPRRSPSREYFGSSSIGFGDPASFPRGGSAFNDGSREVHGFGEGARSFNLSSGPTGNPFHDGRFPPGHLDGAGNHRFGEFRAPGNDAVFGPDGPGHLGRGKFSGPGNFPGNFGMGESAAPGVFPGHGRGRELGGPPSYPRPPFNESVRGDRFAHFGEPAMHNKYPFSGFPNAGAFSGGMDSFEPWKRKPVSTGWCRICEIDCESVEGLELHSQTREHQKMAMDMVKSIKLKNKKQRIGGQVAHDGGSRSRKVGAVGRGSNP